MKKFVFILLLVSMFFVLKAASSRVFSALKQKALPVLGSDPQSSYDPKAAFDGIASQLKQKAKTALDAVKESLARNRLSPYDQLDPFSGGSMGSEQVSIIPDKVDIKKTAELIKTAYSHSPLPRQGLSSFLDPASLKNYLLLHPSVLKFLYRNNFISDQDIYDIAGDTGLNIIKKATPHINADWSIDFILKTPHMTKLSNYYRDNLMTQAGIAGAALATLGGLHYYQKWPLRELQDLEKRFNESNDMFIITVPMLQSIRNSPVFWNDILRNMDLSTEIKNTWQELKRILDSKDNSKINTLLYQAKKRLGLLFGMSQYSPAGLYRRARESAGNTYNWISGYKPAFNKTIDQVKP